jgi:primosomal protein N' (replication factor Y)
MPSVYVDIALPLAVDKLYTYTVPEALRKVAHPGSRAVVPFGSRTMVGIILTRTVSGKSTPPSSNIAYKDILDILDTEPPISDELFELSEWMAQYYLSTPGETLRLFYSNSAISPGKRIVKLAVDEPDAALAKFTRGSLKAAIVKELAGGKKMTVSNLQKKLGKSNFNTSLNELASSGIISIQEKRPAVTKKRKVNNQQRLEPDSEITKAKTIALNAHQQAAVQAIGESLRAQKFQPYLLHGITGSGKTQVYIEAIREALRLGKTAIALVPEISLTSQIVRRFKVEFGENVAAMHSRMTLRERSDVWELARQGKCSIIIGPRSAIFAPLKNVGIIVVDEEHEGAYKQFDQHPRYHGRDVAIMRAKVSNAVIILGSATPSLESYANALSGKYRLLELPERVDDAKLPGIEIVDMTVERKRKSQESKDLRKLGSMMQTGSSVKPFEQSALSDRLKEKIADRLSRREGIILLQNRRGFSPLIECQECGFVEICPHCNISLTFHATKKHLRCHYCGFTKQPPKTCQRCGGTAIEFRGFGTQRVEEELAAAFPTAQIARMDLDTTTERGSHDAILQSFGSGAVDILLGTQMVAKGLDFSRVTLVGVISADTQMLLPDFRSAERTFQLLTQVAGRAGRSTLAGEVIIQTFQPGHPSLKHVVLHDFKGFYSEEMNFRNELAYPPNSRLVLIEFSGKNEKEISAACHTFSDLLRTGKPPFSILGPAPAALSKLKKLYRWHIVLKNPKQSDTGAEKLHVALEQATAVYRNSAFGKKRAIRVSIDVDPVSMM